MIINILITVTAISSMSGILALLLVFAERYLANYGECKITINEKTDLSVMGGSSLLSTLNNQKIFLPSACGGRGTCAYCKCKVVAGVGPILPTEEPLLSDTEITNGVRLACQVKVKQDVKIEIPEELFNIKEFETEVEFIKELTYDIKLVRFKLIEPNEIEFKAGQYIQLYTQPYADVKESVSRAYSIASPSFEKNHVELMIRLIPDGISTTWVHQHVRQHDHVKLVGPMGDFYLRDGDEEIVMVAGGSGMAPMVSLLHHIEQESIQRKITYFFGAVTKKDLFYLDEMKSFEQRLPSFTFVPALSAPEPDDDWEGETGLITVALEKYLQSNKQNNRQGYLCGSPGMIDACIEVMKNNGISDEQIFFDPFA
jgi:Na+-transporting NADH:ubiquinone oxidoreductase subunit F